MANKSISQLTASASNLASANVLPVVQTTGVGPVKMTGLQLAGGLLGSATFNGSIVSTSQPVLNLSQTWNDGAGGTVPFTGLQFNATDTASASNSRLLDLQVGTASQFFVTKNGNTTSSNLTITTSGATGAAVLQMSNNSSYGFHMAGTYPLTWGSTSSLNGSIEVTLRRGAGSTLAAPQLQLGAADAAAPVAQTLQVQSVVAGTSNTAGTNWTLKGSAGTGDKAGGSIIFQVAPAGTSGPSQNSYQTALSVGLSSGTNNGTGIYLGGQSFAGLISYDPNSVGLRANGGWGLNVGQGFIRFATAPIQWGADFNSGDTILVRDGQPNTLALRNSTSPQTFNVYASYTDASNYSRLTIRADNGGGATQIWCNGAGTGTNYPLQYLAASHTFSSAAGAQWWTFNSSGHFLAVTDNLYDIGASGANRPRNLFVAGNGVFGGNIQSSSYLQAGTGLTVAGTGFLQFSTRSIIYSPADGNIQLVNAAVNDFGRLQFGGTTSSFPALKRISSGNCLQVIAADNTASAGFIVGNQALATTATDGFLYIPTCAGTPTGVPTTQTGTAPLVVDSTGNKLYVYVGGAWTAMN